MNNNFNNYGFPVNNNPFMNQPNGVGGNTPYFAPTKPMEYDGYFGSNSEPPKPSFMDKLSGFFERYGGSILKWGLALVGLGGGIAFVKNYRDTDVSYGKGTQKPDDNAGFMPKFKYAVCNFFSSDLGWLKPHTAGAKEADKTEATSTKSAPAPAQTGKDDENVAALKKTVEEFKAILKQLSDTNSSITVKINGKEQNLSKWLENIQKNLPNLDDIGKSKSAMEDASTKFQNAINDLQDILKSQQIPGAFENFKSQINELQAQARNLCSQFQHQANGNDHFEFETDSKTFKSLQNGYEMKGVKVSGYSTQSVTLTRQNNWIGNNYNDTHYVLNFIDNGFQVPISEDNIKGMSQWQNSSGATRTTVIQAMGDKYLQLLQQNSDPITANQLKNLINGIKLAATAPTDESGRKKLQFDNNTVSTALSVYKKILDDLTKNTSLQDNDKQEVIETILKACHVILQTVVANNDAKKKDICGQIHSLHKFIDTNFSSHKFEINVSPTYIAENIGFSNACQTLIECVENPKSQAVNESELNKFNCINELKALRSKLNKTDGSIDPTQQQEINDYCYTLLKVIDTVSKNKEDFSNPDAVLETARKQLREVLPHVKYTSSDGSEVNVATLRNVAMDFELVALEDDIQQGKKSDEDIANELQAAAGLIFSDPSKGESELELISNETTKPKPTPDQQASFITVLTEVYLHKNTGTAREQALTYLKAMMKTYDSTKDANETIKKELQNAINDIISHSLKGLMGSNANKQTNALNMLNILSEYPTLLTTDNIGQIFKVFEDNKYLAGSVKKDLMTWLNTLQNKITDASIQLRISTFLIEQKVEDEKSTQGDFNNWCYTVFETKDGNTTVKENANIAGLLGFCKQHNEMKLTPEQLQALADNVGYEEKNKDAIKQLIELANGNKEVINTIMEKLKGAGDDVVKAVFESLKNAVFTGSGTDTKLVDGVNTNDVIALCAKQEKQIDAKYLQALADKVEYKEENKETIKQLIELANGAKATSVINTIMEKLKGAGDDVVKAVFESLKNAVFTGSGTDTKLVDGVNTNDVIALCAKQEKPELTPDQLRTLAVKLYISNNGTYEFDSTVTSETINNFIKLLKKGINNAELKYNVQTIAKTLDQITNWPDGLGDLKSSLEALQKGG